jgi:outer membrane protein OmpA-like peptidoglycan-associated protein
MVLSDKRAHAAVNHLISRGIDPKRLTYKGYGETMHINKCKNGVECTEDEHQKNRRTEFKVKKINP